MNKSKQSISFISNLITHTKTLNPKIPNLKSQRFLHNASNPFQFNPIPPKPTFYFPQRRYLCAFTEAEESRALREMFNEIEREEYKEREAKRKAGEIVADDFKDDTEDFLGVSHLIEKYELELSKPHSKPKLDFLDETADSDSDDDDVADITQKLEERRKGEIMFNKICSRHQELIKAFTSAKTFDDAYNLMMKIKRFEEKHFHLLPEYRVIGELLNRFKDATGKDKFLLALKLNRAMRLVKRKEKFNPNDSANYGVIQRKQHFGGELVHDDDEPLDKSEGVFDDDEEEFDDAKGRDDLLLEKINDVDKQLEEKLAALDYTFGRKGKVLEEEIRALAEERNALTEKKKKPLYRKGFGTKLIDINRTCKVTKGGQVIKYTAILACGNYDGIVGYAKERGPAIPIALQKAREKCYQNLHSIDRYEDHTIAHAIQTKYKKTKVYLWPAGTTTGVKAGKTVEAILHLAGLKNVKSKVIGSRNPHNTVKAVFQALNAIETPKDVQEKFGRTVVESYLL